jgi:hypothetical protein
VGGKEEAEIIHMGITKHNISDTSNTASPTFYWQNKFIIRKA